MLSVRGKPVLIYGCKNVCNTAKKIQAKERTNEKKIQANERTNEKKIQAKERTNEKKIQATEG